MLTADGNGGVIAGWRGYSVSQASQPAEAQHVNADGTLGPASTVSVNPGAASRLLALSPARPNPSSGAVSFTLELAEAAQASVTIFDAQGRRVRDLVAAAILGPGARTVQWRLDNADGRLVAPGVYLARAHAAGRSVVRAVLVLD